MAAPATQGMLQDAVIAMEGNMNRGIAELKQRLMESLQGTINRQQIENNANIERYVVNLAAKTLERVDTAVPEKTEEQSLRVDARFKTASGEIGRERMSDRQLLEGLETKLLKVGDGNLDRAGTNII